MRLSIKSNKLSTSADDDIAVERISLILFEGNKVATVSLIDLSCLMVGSNLSFVNTSESKERYLSQ